MGMKIWLWKILRFIILVVLAVVVYRKIKAKTLTWKSVKNTEQKISKRLNKITSFLTKREEKSITKNRNSHRALIQPEEELVMEWDPCRFAKLYATLIMLAIWAIVFFVTIDILTMFLMVSYVDRYVFSSMLTGILIPLSIFGSIILIIYLVFLFHMWLRGHKYLAITSKRVYYLFLDHQVSLPLDCISAAGTNTYHMLVVSTPSGSVRIPWVRNFMQMHQTIVDLLIHRQNAAKAAPAEVPGKTQMPDTPAPAEEPASESVSVSEPEPEMTAEPAPVPETETVTEPAAVPEPEEKAAPEPPKKETDPFAPLSKRTAMVPEGMRIGRCVMCRRVELPVKTVPVLVAGVERRRTLCEKCIQKHAVQ